MSIQNSPRLPNESGNHERISGNIYHRVYNEDRVNFSAYQESSP